MQNTSLSCMIELSKTKLIRKFRQSNSIKRWKLKYILFDKYFSDGGPGIF